MFFGTSIWPVKWHPPYDEGIRRVASLGLRGVELIGWRPHVLDESFTPEINRHLRDLIASEGLKLTCFWFNANNLGSPDVRLREEAVTHFRRAIEIAVELGSPIVGATSPYPFAIETPRLLARPTTQEWNVEIGRDLDWSGNYQDYVAAWTDCCAYAATAGLQVTIEPHPYRWVCGAQSMLRLIERTGATNLGMNLDPSHLFPNGEIPHYTVYQMGKGINHTHFSDNDGQTNAHWRPGKGKIDWTALLRSLHDVGYKGVLSLELEGAPGAAKRDVEPTPEIDRQIRIAVAYLSEICAAEGIPIDG